MTNDDRKGLTTNGQVKRRFHLFVQLIRGFSERTHNPVAAGSSPAGPTKQKCRPRYVSVACEDLPSGLMLDRYFG
jgi:hypothetical protein